MSTVFRKRSPNLSTGTRPSTPAPPKTSTSVQCQCKVLCRIHAQVRLEICPCHDRALAMMLRDDSKRARRAVQQSTDASSSARQRLGVEGGMISRREPWKLWHSQLSPAPAVLPLLPLSPSPSRSSSFSWDFVEASIRLRLEPVARRTKCKEKVRLSTKARQKQPSGFGCSLQRRSRCHWSRSRCRQVRSSVRSRMSTDASREHDVESWQTSMYLTLPSEAPLSRATPHKPIGITTDEPRSVQA